MRAERPVFCTIVLVIYMGTFRLMAAMAADSSADLAAVRNVSPAIHAALATVLLLVATVLAIYKPKRAPSHARCYWTVTTTRRRRRRDQCV